MEPVGHHLGPPFLCDLLVDPLVQEGTEEAEQALVVVG
jgi:hypothetical protein